MPVTVEIYLELPKKNRLPSSKTRERMRKGTFKVVDVSLTMMANEDIYAVNRA